MCNDANDLFCCLFKGVLCLASYSKILKDPLEAVRDIYENLNWEVTPQMMENMQRHLEENKQHKYGRHIYDLEKYDITEEHVRDQLSEYIEYFDNLEKQM